MKFDFAGAIKFNVQGQTFNDGCEVPVPECCNGWIAINKGDTLVRVNNIALKPYPPGHPELSGESFTAAGNKGEFFHGKLTVVFSDTPGTDLNILIVFKYYIKETF